MGALRTGTSLGCAAAVAVAFGVLGLPASTAAQAAPPVTQTFDYTGGEQTFVVPTGVTDLS